MNSWRFNSVANYFLRLAIAEAYKVVKEIKATTIHLKDGTILKLKPQRREELRIGIVSNCTTCNDEINYKGVCEMCYTELKLNDLD